MEGPAMSKWRRARWWLLGLTLPLELILVGNLGGQGGGKVRTEPQGDGAAHVAECRICSAYTSAKKAKAATDDAMVVAPATPYIVPAPKKQPKHLFHFIIRYE